MKNTLIFISLFFFNLSFCQIEISEISISDTILISTINNYIIERKKEYPPFETKGFITLNVNGLKNKSMDNDTIRSYTINDQYFDLRENQDELFPLYYTYIGGKLLLVYFKELDVLIGTQFSKKSKRKLIKRMEPFLNKKTHLKLKDEKGNVLVNDKNFRDTSYNLHGGIKVYVNTKNEYFVEKNHH